MLWTLVRMARGSEPEPERQTVRATFSGTESRTGTVGTGFGEPQQEPDLYLSQHDSTTDAPHFQKKQSKPKPGTARERSTHGS